MPAGGTVQGDTSYSGGFLSALATTSDKNDQAADEEILYL